MAQPRGAQTDHITTVPELAEDLLSVTRSLRNDSRRANQMAAELVQRLHRIGSTTDTTAPRGEGNDND